MMIMADDRCILLFTKYPDKGAVKTRLAQGLSGINVEDLYRTFVLDTITFLDKTAVPCHICTFPENAQESFKAWLGSHRRFIPQHGKDLGDRMLYCFRHAFSQGFQRIIALGTDSPDLPDSFIAEAFSCLKTHDSVIGPSSDGGYYLIGFRKDSLLQQVFNKIRWGTDTVFPQTAKHLNEAGHKTHILPMWHDIDTVDDLIALYERGRTSTFRTSRTMALLGKHYQLIPFPAQLLPPPA